MNDKTPKQHDTTLHLAKFAPGPAAASDETTGATIAMKRAAQQTVEQAGHVAMPKDSGELPPAEMLGAVSYCYAKGVYSSEEIEARMLRDSRLRESVHGEVPRAEAIRRFRLLNRDMIRTTLERAFGFLRKRASSSADASAPKTPTGVPPNEGTISIVRREASERLDQAAFVDNMSKE
jgi:hypothetical protein